MGAKPGTQKRPTKSAARILETFASDVALALRVWSNPHTIADAVEAAKVDCRQAAETHGGMDDLEACLSRLESSIRAASKREKQAIKKSRRQPRCR